VIEWAGRAALFSRMVSRAYYSNNVPTEIGEAVSKVWDLAARASRLEGEVASHTRKLEALERRGRALRAEIGRKVEELAHEESRVRREIAGYQEEGEKLRVELMSAEQEAGAARAAADAAEMKRMMDRSIFERAGAAAARVESLREILDKLQQKRVARENVARDLRKQIEELRSQLARYAEALEEDLSAGREKVAARTREGLAFEKGFSDMSAVLISHLKGRPECRDLMNELTAQVAGPKPPTQPGTAGAPPGTRPA
jgi:serine/threonine-protein kinase